MDVREREIGPVAVLEVVGRMVLSESERDQLLARHVIDLVSRNQRRVVVNLAGVTQVDTSGLAILVAAQRAAANGGGQLRLAGPTEHIRHLLTVTRLNTVFQVHETEADAIASLTAGDSSPAS